MFKWLRNTATIPAKELAIPEKNDWKGLFQYLENEITLPLNAKHLMQVSKLVDNKSIKELFHAYLSFEDYLVDHDSAKKYNRETLRVVVAQEFPFIKDEQVFKILFLNDEEAKIYLMKYFVEFCLNHTSATFARSLEEEFIEQHFIILNALDMQRSEQELVYSFSEICSELFDHVTHHFGIGLAASIFHHSYDMCAALYKDHTAFPYIITILPKLAITEQQLKTLTQNQIESLFLEKLETTERLNTVLLQEINEKIEAQNKLKAQEIMLRSIISSALDGILTINDQGKLIAWNPSAENIFGYTAEEVYGKELGELIIPHDLREHHNRGFARFLATKESNVVNKGRLELPAITKDGKNIKVELTITSVIIDGNYFFNGFVRDITNRA
ncbi:MAG: PAS domain S-box protein [Bacteroidota bacterium]